MVDSFSNWLESSCCPWQFHRRWERKTSGREKRQVVLKCRPQSIGKVSRGYLYNSPEYTSLICLYYCPHSFESFDLLSNLFCETSRPAFIAFRQQYNPHRLVQSTTLLDVLLYWYSFIANVLLSLYCFRIKFKRLHILLVLYLKICFYKMFLLSLTITYWSTKLFAIIPQFVYDHSSLTSESLLLFY